MYNNYPDDINKFCTNHNSPMYEGPYCNLCGDDLFINDDEVDECATCGEQPKIERDYGDLYEQR